jgi:excisionase family DNA binding protein
VPPTLYTLESIGEILHLGRSATYKAVKTGFIPTIRVGRRYLVPKDALQKLIDQAK